MSYQSIEALFGELESRDIHLRLADSKLRVNTPKKGIPDELRDKLGTRKQEIIDFLIAAREDDDVLPLLGAQEYDSPAPLSFGQQRSWFLHELNKDDPSAFDTLTFNLRMQGTLNKAALVHSLTQLVARHEILRTVVTYYEEQPLQQILSEQEVALPIRDLSSIPAQGRTEELDRSLVAANQKLLDPAAGPLFQVQLIKLDEDDHVLIFIIHHMIFDGWSSGILTRELMALYEGYVQGDLHPLASPVLQYGDFARWQRNWLQSDELNRHLAYWKNNLENVETLELPLDYSRPTIQTYNGNNESIILSAEVTEKFVKLGQKNDASLFMTMITALGLLLSRYSGQTDIAIGTPITSRDRRELQEMIGFFLNTLVMRLDYSTEDNFLGLLNRCRKTCLDAFAHQHLPFEKLVEELRLERDRSRSPLFQVMFVLNGAPDSKPLQLPGLELSSIPQRSTGARFDLEVAVVESSEGLVINFNYNTDLFDADTIRRLLKHYRNLLQSVVANPDQPVSELSMLSAEERQQFLDWNPAPTDYPRAETIHGLFEQQVSKSPDAIALEFEGQTLSYSRLNSQANQLAHYLQTRGVGADVIVAICVERSLEMVIGLLAILKAGGAYLPLDPDCPVDRLNYMLEDSGAKLLLSKGSLPADLLDSRVVCLDRDAAAIAEQEVANLALSATAEDLAYVIYTSGSTGKPKGVMGLHRGIVNRLSWGWAAYPYAADERCCQKTTLNFVDSVAEIFSPLLAGLSLMVAGEATLKDVRALARLVSSRGVTRLMMVPSLLRALLDLDEEVLNGLDCVRYWITSGERLEAELEFAFRARFPDAVLLNFYGSSEVSADVTCFDTAERGERAGSLIGRPIANTRAYVLDGGMNQVPVGVPGELYIGGDGLARGYQKRPELTAERFVPDSFSDEPGARLYRMGDRVRYLADGNLEFLGRTDDQIKLRGFRIELGEIESALLKHQKLSDAIVIVHEDDEENKRLLAYVVAHNADAPSATSLREFIAKSLPNYMLPSAFVILEKLPLTDNGKIDRKALPLPDDLGNILETEYVAPRNELERELAQIWAEVLKLERVGIHDNFFDLGGHSLMATQVVSRIRAQLNVELPLSEMFGYPTVAELAPVMESLLDNSDGVEVEIIPLADRSKPMPLSFAQERLWFLDQLDPDSAAYNMCLALRLKGELGVTALTDSLNAIVGRQEGLRTRFTMHQGKPYQITEDVTIELVQDDLSALASGILEDEVNTRIDAEALLPFDLSTGPLLRCRLLRLSDREHVLLMTMHHVISDGWSLGVMFRELGACYEAFSRGEQPALAELSIRYADFAAWQREWLSGEVLASQMAYWRGKLEGLSTLNLPTDRPRPAVQTYTGSMEKMRLDAELSKRLTSLSRQVGVTLFMTMLAGFAVLMHRYSGQQDIVVGSPVANRNRSELEDLIGFFVNSLVMRTDVSGNPGFRELVQRVNRNALDAYQHQDLPFEKLVDEIQPERDLSHNPLFQVMFALQNAPIESLELKGLTLESVSREAKVSGFDLECHAWESGERLEVVFVYNTDLFDASTIRRMMTHYRRLLEASTASPETPVGQLEILDDEEKNLILHQWNQTGADYIKSANLHSLFEQQANRMPHAEAVRFETLSLDYAELNRKANELAFFLLAENVEPGQLVGIYIERSIDLIVAILGILKAGAAYVPLDPENPAERIKYIVQDSDIRILLSQQKFENRLPTDLSEIFYLDDSKLLADVTPRALPVVSEDMLAYVIYTSGSTGKPKGVMVPHRAVVNHACWMQERFNLDHTDRTLQKAPINFDISVGEIFDSLLSGACVVMARPGGDSDSAYLIQEIRENRITIVTLVPSALRMLLHVLNDPAGLDTLRFMGCGGEELTPDLLREYYRKCSVPLYNLYGPTEATNDSTSFLCPADFEGDHVPIGNPIDNARAYILDRRLQPVPIGVTGELHIGGAGLALGYLNQPGLTAEKFIADPFSIDPEARLYKTGDLARYRADGNIEFHGRLDQQVKLRGFRIEPGEIESALVSHEALKDALVIVREDKPGDQRLVAYLIANGGEVNAPSVTNLRAYLRTRLPGYMVPAAFMLLDHFPLNANGKLDRRALPMPEGERQVDEAYVEPRSDLEKQLAEIWQEVLDVDQVGIHDNFFDLGGHSLKLVELHKKLSDKIDTPLTLVDLFAHPTVSALVEHITKPQTPTSARSGKVDRVTNMAAGNKRLKQLRQSRKRNTGIKG